MRCFTGIKREVAIGKDRAAHGSDQNRSLANAQFIDDLGYQAVGNSMGASGTIVGQGTGQGFRSFVY
jgi:hypothetical protein